VLGGLLSGYGVTPEAIADGRARLEALACTLEDTARMLAQEYGQPIRDGTAPAFSPARLPAIRLLEPAAGATLELNLEPLLGKPATRGHVANLGAEEVRVRFVGLRDETPSAWYHLPASAVLDFSSWIVRRLEVAASSSEAARAQVLAQ